MSMVVAFALPDGAVLVADGRLVSASEPNETLGNDADKIHELMDGVYAMPVGVTPPTNWALGLLKELAPKSRNAAELSDMVTEALSGAWGEFDRHFTDFLKGETPVRAGLVIGGVVNESPLIGGVLLGSGISMSRTIKIGQPFSYIVLGGEDQGSHSLFRQQVTNLLRGFRWTNSEETRYCFSGRVVLAAVKTIRQVEKTNSTIGGVIRYAIIRTGHSIVKRIWEGD